MGISCLIKKKTIKLNYFFKKINIKNLVGIAMTSVGAVGIQDDYTNLG